MKKNSKEQNQKVSIEDRLIQLEAIVVVLIREYDRNHGDCTEEEVYEAETINPVTEKQTDEMKVENRLDELWWVVLWLYGNLLTEQGRKLDVQKRKKINVKKYERQFKAQAIEKQLSDIEDIAFILCKQHLKNAGCAYGSALKEECDKDSLNCPDNNCDHWMIANSFLYTTRMKSELMITSKDR